jgi:hypothetical protein
MTGKVDNPPKSDAKTDRRGPNRDREDADWERKALGRVRGRLRSLSKGLDQRDAGWESTVLDTLRKRIEKDSQ